MKRDVPVVFIVDDSESVRRSLERLIRSEGLTARCFESARGFLECGGYDGPCCIVLDVMMPGLSGFDLQEEMAALNMNIPIIFLTGYGSIPESVRAMKAGAVDFLEKPFNDAGLLEVVRKALEKSKDDLDRESEIREIRGRIRRLTPREYEVFTHVIRGKLNKQIAYDLGTVEKTIKVHRAQVMRKLLADSVADLVRMAGKAGVAVD